MKTQKPFLYAFAVTLGILTATVAVAWTGPSAAPPGSNASAPLNASATAQSKAAGLILNTGGASTGLVVYGNVGIGQTAPNARFDVSNNGGSDGLTITQTTDNTETIQTYIDGHYSDRAIYASGCCNVLKIQPDIGDTQIGAVTMLHSGNITTPGNVSIGASSIADAPLRITFNDGTGGVTGIHIQNTNGGANAYSGVYYFSNTDTVSGSVFQGFNNSTHEFRFNNVATTPSLNFMTGSVSRIYVNSSGNVGVGTVTPGQKLDVAGAVQATAFYYSSDERLKKNIETISSDKALQDILALNPVTYNWKDPAQPTDTQIGFIAQQVEAIAPQLVTTNPATGMKSVDYARAAPLLVGALQAQQKQIDELKAEIAKLKAGK